MLVYCTQQTYIILGISWDHEASSVLIFEENKDKIIQLPNTKNSIFYLLTFDSKKKKNLPVEIWVHNSSFHGTVQNILPRKLAVRQAG